MGLIDLVNGKIERINGREIIVVEKKLKDLECTSLVEYILQHREALFQKNIAKRFPKLAHLPKERMLFFDTENCGLAYSDPIFLIGTAHFHREKDISLKLLFARDYSEERAVIEYFLGMLKNYDAFFTYNGATFDVPRIQERARQNGIPIQGTLKEQMNDEHQDLFKHLKGMVRLPDRKLQTVERLLFNFHRTNDVSGEAIPRAYLEYVYGRKTELEKIPRNQGAWQACLKFTEQDLRRQGQDLREVRRVKLEQLARQRYDSIPDAKYKNSIILTDQQANPQRVEERMARVINHNFYDVASMIALLTYLCEPKNLTQNQTPTTSNPESQDDVVPF